MLYLKQRGLLKSGKSVELIDEIIKFFHSTLQYTGYSSDEHIAYCIYVHLLPGKNITKEDADRFRSKYKGILTQ